MSFYDKYDILQKKAYAKNSRPIDRISFVNYVVINMPNNRDGVFIVDYRYRYDTIYHWKYIYTENYEIVDAQIVYRKKLTWR